MKSFVACALLLSLCISALADNDHGENSVDFDKDSFAAVVNEKPLFVMFFAPWCGHCKRLAPTWDELAQEKNVEGGEVTVGKVDCTVHTQLCSDHGVRGYPTLKFFNKKTEGDKFSGARTIDKLRAFVEEKLGDAEEKADEQVKSTQEPAKEKEKPQEENGLYTLTKDNFDDHVAKGHHFVKFYAPWCGHCKRLAPTWDELAAKTKEGGKAKIAKVDCTQQTAVCTKFSVRGYPTLIWITDGQKNEEYSGGRDIGSLSGFVDKMTSAENQDKTSVDGKVPDSTVEEKREPEVQNGLYVLTEDTFDAHVKTGVHFIKFYAPWCGHCKKLAPTWDSLAKNFEDGSKIKIGKVDCTQNRKVCGKYSVTGYPTLLYIVNGENKLKYSGGRDLDSLTSYTTAIIEQYSPKQEEKQEEKQGEEEEEEEKDDLKIGVVELGDEDFVDTIAEDLTLVLFADEKMTILFDKDCCLFDEDFVDAIAEVLTLVLLANEKCTECPKIIEVLEKVSDELEEPEMMLAVVNCDKNKKTCEAQNVKEDFPKLKLFNNGKYVGLYTGERTFDAMKGYIRHQLNTLGGHGGEL